MVDFLYEVRHCKETTKGIKAIANGERLAKVTNYWSGLWHAWCSMLWTYEYLTVTMQFWNKC